MPFNASGFFQRLFNWRNDRDAEIKILAERMDQEMDGIVAGINDIVSGEVDWKGPMTGVFGTATAPAYSFQEDPNTGVYRVSADVLGFSVGGTKKAEVTATGLNVSGSVTATGLNVSGSVTATGLNVSGSVTATGLNVSGTTTLNDIRVDDTDFIVRDSTDATTNYIWRDHSASRLYLGASGSADVHFRSDVDFGSNVIASNIVQRQNTPNFALETTAGSSVQSQFTMEGARTDISGVIAQMDFRNEGDGVEGLSARWQIKGNGDVNLQTGTLKVGGNDVATTGFVTDAIANAPGKIVKVHTFYGSTDYTRTSATEGTISQTFTFTPASSTSRFAVFVGARMRVHNKSGGNDARGTVSLAYYHSADAEWKTARMRHQGLVNVTPTGSGATLYSYAPIDFKYDVGRALVAYGGSANQVRLALRGKADYANTEIQMQQWDAIVLEYET